MTDNERAKAYAYFLMQAIEGDTHILMQAIEGDTRMMDDIWTAFREDGYVDENDEWIHDE